MIHFDWTISIGNILTAVGAIVAITGFSFRHFRTLDRLTITLDYLTRTVGELAKELKHLGSELHEVDTRVAVLEHRPRHQYPDIKVG